MPIILITIFNAVLNIEIVINKMYNAILNLL